MIFFLRLSLICLALGGMSWAHQVPNMTIEAGFTEQGQYTLKVNFDPRLFLSSQPAELPSVTASWYLDQTEAQRQETHAKAWEYLTKNLHTRFAGNGLDLPRGTLIPLDGATSTEIKPDTTELHLLGTVEGELPLQSGEWILELGKEANVSLILLTSVANGPQGKLQVIFPGESSRPLQLDLDLAASEVSAAQGDEEPSTSGALIVPSGLAMVIALFLLIFVVSTLLIKRQRP